MLHSKKIRDQKGAAITGLVIALMFFILMSGLFCFDASRVQMAQRELSATCDASALAGTAMLTSYDVSNDPSFTKLADAQQNAAAFSYNMFNMGNILGTFLQGNTSLVTNLSQLTTTTDGEAKVVIGLVDPQNSYQVIDPTPPQNQNGRAIAVFAGYGYHPIFISFYGVGNVGILASSIGGLPQVDAILVFDYSGSMDDLTQVSFVKRWWNPNPDNGRGYTGGEPDSRSWRTGLDFLQTIGIQSPGLTSGHTRGCIQYDLAPSADVSNHSIINYVDLDLVANIQGTSVNGLPPQNLSNSELGTLGTGDAVLVFKPFLRHPRYRNDYDTPPGNCPAYRQQGGFWQSVIGDPFAFDSATGNEIGHQSSAWAYPPWSGVTGISNNRTTPGGINTNNAVNIYTDMVVNIRNPGTFPPDLVQPLWGPVNFAGFQVTFPGDEPDATIRGRTYNFSSLPVVVEAARGNLDRNTWFNDTGLHRGFIDNTNLANTYQPQSAMPGRSRGFQKAYQRLAMLVSQPIASATDGAEQGFFQKLSALADCRFGFVGFSDSDPFPASPNADSMATPTTGTWGGAPGSAAYPGKNSYYYAVNYEQIGLISGGTANNDEIVDTRVFGNITNNWNAATEPHQCRQNQGGGRRGFRIPRAELTANGSITQAQSLNWVTKGNPSSTIAWSHPRNGDGLYNGRPLSGTMCAEALDTARQEFNGSAYDGLSRAGSKRAIVFFTDGIPSGGISSGEATSSQAVADQCAADGVALFTIGLNMLDDPTLKAQQETFLGNGSGGLAGRAGNGGRYFSVQSTEGIKQAFSAIARRLTQSQR